MKLILKLLLAFILCAGWFSSISQEITSGEYEGILEVPGMQLDMSIQLNLDNGIWSGDLDIPKQNIKNMALGDLKIEGNTISFKLPEVPGNAHYEGSLEESEIIGKFSQGGAVLDLNFKPISENIDYTAYSNRISELIDSILPHSNVPGIGVGVLYKDEIIVSDGFGFRDLDGELQADKNTLFAIGSSSKAFTAAGVAKLASDGKLDWDEPIRMHIPEFELEDEYATKNMSAIDILCHRSGLPRHDLLWYGTPFSRDELIAKLKYVEPNKTFRETWQYQNLMFMTAGVLIERISGQSWEAFTKDQIFTPLGMDASNFSVSVMENHENAALPYRYDDEEETQILMKYRNIDAIGPAGSINSSADDMIKWLRFQLNQGQVDDEEIISSGDFVTMHQPHMVMPGGPRFEGRSARTYGLGWMIHWYDGIKILEHGGNIDGFSAQVLLVPEKELGIVILSNRNGTPLPSLLSYEIVDIMLDIPSGGYLASVYAPKEEEDDEDTSEEEDEETTQIDGTQFSKPISEYAGTFTHEGYGDIVVTLEDNQLMGKYYDIDIPLEHYHFDIFEGDLGDLGQKTKIQFHMDMDGNIVALSTLMEPTMSPIRFEKQGNKAFEDAEYLEKFVGQYKTPNLNLSIELKNNKLYILPAGQPSYELIPMDKNKFKPKDLPGFSIEFIVENGQVTSAKLNQPNGVFTAEKIEE